MVLTELQTQVNTLSRHDKYHLIQFILSSLEQEEEKMISLEHGAEYPIWSPYDAKDAAKTLYHALKQEKVTHE